jgi:hypothetical protein
VFAASFFNFVDASGAKRLTHTVRNIIHRSLPGARVNFVDFQQNPTFRYNRLQRRVIGWLAPHVNVPGATRNTLKTWPIMP